MWTPPYPPVMILIESQLFFYKGDFSIKHEGLCAFKQIIPCSHERDETQK